MSFSRWIERAQGSPRFRNNPLIRIPGAWVIRRLLHFGKYQWETKDYDFWTFLMIALRVVKPLSIVELGTGRSSSFLAEYAGKHGAELACVEQNRWFARRMRRALSSGLLDDRFLCFVPLADDGWYTQGALDTVTPPNLEMLFVDGPVGDEEGLGRGSRDSARAYRWMRQTTQSARLLIVDDVNRPRQLRLFEELAETSGLATGFLVYPAARNDGIVAVAMGEREWASVRAACTAIGITIYGDFPDYDGLRHRVPN